jgi:hypothetical protein
MGRSLDSALMAEGVGALGLFTRGPRCRGLHGRRPRQHREGQLAGTWLTLGRGKSPTLLRAGSVRPTGPSPKRRSTFVMTLRTKTALLLLPWVVERA